MKKVTSINGINLLVVGDYLWEILHENDGTELYKITLGDQISGELITLFYGEGTLSIRKFATTYDGDGDVFYLKMKIENSPAIIDALLMGHNLKMLPLFHISTAKLI